MYNYFDVFDSINDLPEELGTSWEAERLPDRFELDENGNLIGVWNTPKYPAGYEKLDKSRVW